MKICFSFFHRFHLILIHLFETRFEIVLKANIDSVQHVEPHKFSSIELNPHFVRSFYYFFLSFFCFVHKNI